MALSEMTRLSSEVLGTELVTLVVGPERKPFIIHKKRLSDRCEYFCEAFNSESQEASTGVLNFPFDTEEAFTTFITWLYGGTILLPKIPTSEAADQHLSTSDFLEKHFLPSFILADKLCNHDLMNRLIDFLQDFQQKHLTFFNATTTQRVFEEISSQSKLHLYFVASFAFFLAKSDCKVTSDSFVDKLGTKPDFLRALFKFQQETGKKLHDYDFDLWDICSFGPCYFHTHGEGDDCYRK